MFNSLKNTLKIHILLCFCCFFSPTSNAFVEYINPLEHITQVNNIIQDQQGFIWLGTQNGLYRYDGHQLVNMTKQAKQPSPFQWIHHISFVDKQLLLATEKNGLWLYDPKNNNAELVSGTENISSIYIAEKIDHFYYFYSRKNNILYKLDTRDNTLIKQLININIKKLNKAGHHLIIQTPQNIRLLLANGKQKVIEHNTKISLLSNNKNFATLNYSAHNLQVYLYADNGDLLNSNLININRNIDISSAIYANDNKNILVYLSDGELLTIDTATLRITDRYKATNPILGVHTMLEDSAKLLWIINNQGIHLLNRTGVKNFQIHSDVVQNYIVITAFENNIVYGTYGDGIGLLFNKQGRGNNLQAQLITPFNQASSKKQKRVLDIFTFDDTLFIATFDGLWKFKQGKLTKVAFSKETTLVLHLSRINNLLLIATDGDGFYLYDTVNDKTTLHVNDVAQLSSLEILDVLPLSPQLFWLATANGIDIYSKNTNTIKNIPLAIRSKVVSITSIANKIFAATSGDGIFVFNHDGELLTQLNANGNFFWVKAINNKLWAPTNNGLYQIDPITYQSILIPDTELIAFTDSPMVFDQKIYIAHFGGVLSMPMQEKDFFNAPVKVSKLYISGQPFYANQMINLDSANEMVTFQLSSLDYRPGQNKKYQYKINHSNWHDIIGNQLTLTGLASGNYHIEFKATNSLGYWSNQHAFAQVNVKYPWYWTPEIRFLYILVTVSLFCTAIWLLYLRTKSIKYIHQLLQNDLKSKGSTALNVLHNLIVTRNILQAETNTNQQKLLQLVDESITQLESSNNQTEPNALMGSSLSSSIPYFCDYILQKFHIVIESKLDFNEQKLSLELQSDIYRLIYEAITSAIRNGSSTKFSLVIKENKAKLWLTIQDDAGSFVNYNSKVQFNIAMYYIRQIANKYNASVNTYDEQTNGSQLIISIPLFINLNLD
jgi:ligand-binding sensor domain-containing protein